MQIMSNYTDGILTELRNRLELVKRRIAVRLACAKPDTPEWEQATGALVALRDEQLFLAGMIAEIEKVTT